MEGPSSSRALYYMYEPASSPGRNKLHRAQSTLRSTKQRKLMNGRKSSLNYILLHFFCFPLSPIQQHLSAAVPNSPPYADGNRFIILHTYIEFHFYINSMPGMRMGRQNECEGKLNENCLISEIEFAGKQTEEINRIKFFYDILHKSNQIHEY